MDNTDIDRLLSRRKKLEADLATLKQKAAVAEADNARIKSEVAKVLLTLKNDFKCETLEEAKNLRDSMVVKINDACDELEAKLDAIRGV